MTSITAIIPDNSLVPELVGVPTPFFILATVAFVARIVVRFQRKKVGFDDVALAAGMCCAIGYYIVYMVDIAAHALGRHAHIFINEFYVWTVTFVKISLACMLLRIQPAKSWRIGLFIFVGILVCYAIACSLVNYLQCRPLKAFWDLSYSRDHCLPLEVFRDWVYGGSSFFLLTDVLLSLLPTILLFHIHIPIRDKVAVCILMGLGILASLAAIPKFISLRHLGTNYDWTWESAKVDLWSLLEMCLGIFATSIIVLKGAFQNTFRGLYPSSKKSASQSGGTGEDHPSKPPVSYGGSSHAATDNPEEPWEMTSQIHETQMSSESRLVSDDVPMTDDVPKEGANC